MICSYFRKVQEQTNMAACCVHHVQLAVKNGSRYVHKLISNVNFQLFAKRSDIHRTDWALRSGSAVFVVSEHRDEILPESRRAEYAGRDSQGHGVRPYHRESGESKSAKMGSDGHGHGDILSLPPSGSRTAPALHRMGYISPPLSSRSLDLTLPKIVIGNIDSVCNVAFEVCDVERTVERALKGGAQVLCEPTVVKDAGGSVTVAVIKSCVGNVVHTILNTEYYNGAFLPGFSEIESKLDTCQRSDDHDDGVNRVVSDDFVLQCSCAPQEAREPLALVKHFDHVTFAIPTGTSSEVLDWYERCFGMNRFWLDRNEDRLEGFLVCGNNVGLRMKAMEYWHCAETGLVFPDQAGSGESEESSCKDPKMMFVVAEALPDQGTNQVETFIEQHGGPGIQHIGLYTPDIEATVGCLAKRGLDFMVPPAAYYTEVGKLEEMLLVGRDPEALQRLGILLDAEDFLEGTGTAAHQEEEESACIRYLLQVFTRPFFDRDSFFLEFIQRHGASGFGAGNIKALWRSVEAYMAHRELAADGTLRDAQDRLTY